MDERVAAQVAIQRVYYSHQTGSPRPFEEAVPRAALVSQVEEYLRKTEALEANWQLKVTARMLEGELARMRRDTRMPDRLREIFAALNNDPFLIQETLVRQGLVDRLVRDAFAADPSASSAVEKESWESWWLSAASRFDPSAVPSVASELDGRAVTIPAACPPYDVWMPLGTGEAPSARAGHTAVWTGALMIVWGGTNGSVLGDGSRYDPTTDTWAPISSLGAPSARSSHTAVWTGNDMLVWGGNDGADLASGGRYDPSTDTWSVISPIGAPSPRRGHAAFWTGTRMVIWGGFPSVFSGGQYDPANDTWSTTATSGAPFIFSDFRAVWTGTEMLVWTGVSECAHQGTLYGCTNTSSGGRYNPATNSWLGIPPVNAPSGRTGFTAVWDGTQMIIFGGVQCATSASGCHSEFLTSGGRYNPVTNSWTPTLMVDAPSGGTPVWTGSRMFMSGRIYQPSTNTWLVLSSTNGPDTYSAASVVWTGHEVIVWGGGTSVSYYNSGSRYDFLTNAWSRTVVSPGSPSARSEQTTIWTGSHMIVWGGFTGNQVALGDGKRYDPATAAWSPVQTANAPAPRLAHTAVWTGDRMIVWGGASSGLAQHYDTGGRYDPILDTWTATSTAGVPEMRYVHKAVWAGGRMVVWGGINNTQLSTGGRYNPSTDTWQLTSNVNAPVARSLFTAVSDGQAMIVWGGINISTYLNTGGRYDPVSNIWTQTSTTGAPRGRTSHSAVWTGSEMIVWGGDAPTFLGMGTGGRYNPVSDSWIATSPTNAPAGRYNHSAVWTGSRMIIWGGYQSGQTGSRYDPSTDSWIATAGGAPPASQWTAAVWTGDRMLVWGAGSGGQYLLPDSAADADGDGWSPCAGDCNDANAAVRPGVPELCNGIDDNCDQQIDFPTPSGEMTLLASASAGATQFSWSAIAGATAYDLVKGDLKRLRGRAGDFTATTTACLLSDVATTSALDPEVPEEGRPLWYLSRAFNFCAGHGTYDEGVLSQSGSRDAEIDAAGAACP